MIVRRAHKHFKINPFEAFTCRLHDRMSLGSRKKRKSGVGALAEQLRELSTPLPPSFHPDEEDLACETAARVCDDIEEEEGEGLGRGGLAGEAQRASRLRRVDLEFQDDPRYAGRAVTRRELEGGCVPMSLVCRAIDIKPMVEVSLLTFDAGKRFSVRQSNG